MKSNKIGAKIAALTKTRLGAENRISFRLGFAAETVRTLSLDTITLKICQESAV